MAVVNFLNLPNNSRDIGKQLIVNNPLRPGSVTNSVQTCTRATYNGNLVRTAYINVSSTSTSWGIQLGVKYLF